MTPPQTDAPSARPRGAPMPLALALCAILALQAAGEWLVRSAGIAFPGPLVGMLLLFVVLRIADGPDPALERTADTLVGHLGLFFVPAGSGIVAAWAMIERDAPALLLAVVGSTLGAAVVTSMLVMLLARPPDFPNQRRRSDD